MQKKVQRDEAYERDKDNQSYVAHRCILPVNFSVIMCIYAAACWGNHSQGDGFVANFHLSRFRVCSPAVTQEYRKSNGLFHGQRAPTLLSPALPDASPTLRRAVDAPALGARQRETGLRESCARETGSNEHTARRRSAMRLMQPSGTRDNAAEGLLLGEKLGHGMGQRVRSCSDG